MNTKLSPINRILLLLLVALSILLVAASACAEQAGESEQEQAPEEIYRTLKSGDKNEDVLKLKKRLYWLGYYKSYADLSVSYNSGMVKYIKQFQKNNGLKQTGIATPELQALIYSDKAVTNGEPPTPKPIVAPVSTPELPPLNDQGFLAEDYGEKEFVYKNDDDGHWYYISDSLFIEICRYANADDMIVWFESEVRASAESPLTSYLTTKTKKGYSFESPVDMAQENHIVLAINDDYFGHRESYNISSGVIVRQGEALSNKTYKPGRDRLPNLDTIAVFEDGSMKTYLPDAHTAEEYIEMGARNVLAFGPILLSEGEYGTHVYDYDFFYYKEPRCAIGMIEPFHYILLTVNGRTSTSDGVYFSWMAERLKSLGVQEALNLDGGGSVALVFMGERLNKGGTANTAGSGKTRNLTSVVGFGTSELVQPE